LSTATTAAAVTAAKGTTTVATALSTASPSSIDKERGSSTTTTSVPTAAPSLKCLQVQTTWTYLSTGQADTPRPDAPMGFRRVPG